VIIGGHFGAVKYAVTFAAAGTALDYAALKLGPEWHALKEHLSGKKDWFTLPEWSPLQVLDEEALSKKKAREEKFAQRALGKLDKEDTLLYGLLENCTLTEIRCFYQGAISVRL